MELLGRVWEPELIAPVLACPDRAFALACLEALVGLRQRWAAIDWLGVYRVAAEGLVLTAQLPFPADHLVMPPDDGVCWQVIRSGVTSYIPDATTRPDFIPCEFPTRSSLVVPIRREGVAIAEIEVDAAAADAFSPELIRAVEAAAAGLA